MDAKKAGCEHAPSEHGRFTAQLSGVEPNLVAQKPDLHPASTTQALTGKEGQQKDAEESAEQVTRLTIDDFLNMALPQAAEIEAELDRQLSQEAEDASEWLDSYGALPVCSGDDVVQGSHAHFARVTRLTETMIRAKKHVAELLALVSSVQSASVSSRSSLRAFFDWVTYKRERESFLLDVSLKAIPETMKKSSQFEEAVKEALRQAALEERLETKKAQWMGLHIGTAQQFLEQHPQAGNWRAFEWLPGIGNMGGMRMSPRERLKKRVLDMRMILESHKQGVVMSMQTRSKLENWLTAWKQIHEVLIPVWMRGIQTAASSGANDAYAMAQMTDANSDLMNSLQSFFRNI